MLVKFSTCADMLIITNMFSCLNLKIFASSPLSQMVTFCWFSLVSVPNTLQETTTTAARHDWVHGKRPNHKQRETSLTMETWVFEPFQQIDCIRLYTYSLFFSVKYTVWLLGFWISLINISICKRSFWYFFIHQIFN